MLTLDGKDAAEQQHVGDRQEKDQYGLSECFVNRHKA
jgi:hypothetical protein